MYQDVLEENLFRPNALKAIVGVHGLPCSGPSVVSVYNNTPYDL